jgi:protocatechuate 3,4-dioxygenase alpha subunit
MEQLSPSQTVGPYYTLGLGTGLFGTELVPPGTPGAVQIRGLLLDGAGEPVPDGLIEIWQANAAGRYAHPADTREELALDEGFTGFGRAATADGGRFEFLTVKPGRVPGPTGVLQAPHLNVGVFARGLLKRAATRLYFPDEEEANAADPVLALIPDPEERQTLVAREEDGGLRFDIRLQGDRATVFFAV